MKWLLEIKNGSNIYQKISLVYWFDNQKIRIEIIQKFILIGLKNFYSYSSIIGVFVNNKDQRIATWLQMKWLQKMSIIYDNWCKWKSGSVPEVLHKALTNDRGRVNIQRVIIYFLSEHYFSYLSMKQTYSDKNLKYIWIEPYSQRSTTNGRVTFTQVRSMLFEIRLPELMQGFKMKLIWKYLKIIEI